MFPNFHRAGGRGFVVRRACVAIVFGSIVVRIAIIAVLLAASEAYPLELAGKVTDTAGAAVSGAMVVLVEERVGAMEPVATTHTGSDGMYQLTGVSEGDYSIRAVADNYYQTAEDFPLAAGVQVTKDLTIRPGRTAIHFNIDPNQTFYGNSIGLGPDNLLLFYNPRYIALMDKPKGAELVKSSSTSFIPTLPGDYTFAMMIIDLKGVGREVTDTITMQNDPPRAFPSVIPGPSELPLLYNGGMVKAETNGLNAVKPGGRVYLRGWGEDNNVPSPEVYNTRAYSHETANPLFDIYGNKNGDWSQSDFGFAWILKDAAGADRTSLLDNASSENTWFTVPADAKTGDTFTASLTVMGDAGLASAPVPVTVYIAEEVGTDATPTTIKPIKIPNMPEPVWDAKPATVRAACTNATRRVFP